jgi:hypothetical protein
MGCGDDGDPTSPPGGGGTPTVTGVTVSPNPATVAKDSTQQFSATVQGTNSPGQGVTWEIVESVAAGTTIDTDGLLTVAVGESASSLTVKATSTADTSYSGTATVTLVAAGSTIVDFTDLTANGSSSADTTYLTLTFDAAVPGLAATDITITANSTGTTRGALTSLGLGFYQLGVSGISASGDITVAVANVGGTYINPASRTVAVYKAAPTGGNPADADTLKTKLVSLGVTGATVSGAVVTIPANATLTLTDYVTVKAGVTLTIQDDLSTDDHTVTLNPGSTLTVNGTITVEPGILRVSGSGSDPVTINGAGTGKIQLSGPAAAGENSTLLDIMKTISIADITLQGAASNIGELVWINSAGDLTMTGTAKITGNETDGTNGLSGGVRVLSSGTFTMKDTASVEGNSSSAGAGSPGGVYVQGTFIMEDNSTVKNNSNPSGDGGGVYVIGGTFTMKDNSSVTGNTAYAGGGVCSGSLSTFIMQDNARVGGSAGEGNIATSTSGDGGGGVKSTGTFTMKGHASVTGNSAVYGGGVKSSGTFTMEDNASVDHNTSSQYGGGVYFNGSTFTLTDGYIGDNETTGSSTHGGGVYLTGTATFNMAGGEIAGNIAKTRGGGVYINSGDFVMSGGRILNNIARGGYTSGDPTGYGKSLYNNNGTAEYSDNTVIAAPYTFVDSDLSGH